VLLSLWDKRLLSQNTLLIGTFLLFTVVTAIASARGIPHNRYAFLPGLCFLLLVWWNAREHRYNVVRIVCWAMLVVALWSGARDYQRFWLSYRAVCPAWRDEVRKWRVDHTYQPRVWPPIFPSIVMSKSGAQSGGGK
jgi:hypothetical protein